MRRTLLRHERAGLQNTKTGLEPGFHKPILDFYGRSDRIRTYDPLVPNKVRYQTALHSDDSRCQARTPAL